MLSIELLSPEQTFLNLESRGVTVPTLHKGYMGILPSHSSYITELGIGQVALDGEGAKKQQFFVAGGYVQVDNDTVKILADVVESMDQIDKARAEKAKNRALDRLAKFSDESLDIARAQRALLRAEARLVVSLHKPLGT